jgi:hypothetical protein
MRYADMRDMEHERAGLLDKKRLGKNQKQRLASLSANLQAAAYYQPPATPPCANTGQRGDWQGNVYETHRHGYAGQRQTRRAQRFGRNNIKPMRSRIGRNKRKQRTGGVK